MFITLNSSKRQTDAQVPPAAKLTYATRGDREYGYDQLLLQKAMLKPTFPPMRNWIAPKLKGLGGDQICKTNFFEKSCSPRSTR